MWPVGCILLCLLVLIGSVAQPEALPLTTHTGDATALRKVLGNPAGRAKVAPQPIVLDLILPKLMDLRCEIHMQGQLIGYRCEAHLLGSAS